MNNKNCFHEHKKRASLMQNVSLVLGKNLHLHNALLFTESLLWILLPVSFYWSTCMAYACEPMYRVLDAGQESPTQASNVTLIPRLKARGIRLIGQEGHISDLSEPPPPTSPSKEFHLFQNPNDANTSCWHSDFNFVTKATSWELPDPGKQVINKRKISDSNCPHQLHTLSRKHINETTNLLRHPQSGGKRLHPSRAIT